MSKSIWISPSGGGAYGAQIIVFDENSLRVYDFYRAKNASHTPEINWFDEMLPKDDSVPVYATPGDQIGNALEHIDRKVTILPFENLVAKCLEYNLSEQAIRRLLLISDCFPLPK